MPPSFAILDGIRLWVVAVDCPFRSCSSKHRVSKEESQLKLSRFNDELDSFLEPVKFVHVLLGLSPSRQSGVSSWVPLAEGDFVMSLVIF